MARDLEVVTPANKGSGRGKPQPTPQGEGRQIEILPPDRPSLLQAAYSKRVDVIDKKLGLNSSLSIQPRLSTGLLTLDLMLGNGLVPGVSIFFGAEQSAKSTGCMTTLRSSLQQNIPIRKYFDPEGAVDRRYTGNILGTDSFTDVFGEKNRSGRWIKQPRCRYHDENITEVVFRDIHRTAMFLPDKVFHPDIGEWFLVFERDKDSIALCKELVASKACSPPDKTLYRATNRYWCSVGDDNAPQAVFFVDSLPALVPGKVEEDDEKGQGLANDARVIGQQLKVIRGKLRPKAIIFMAVNQLRDRPMAGPGQANWYEPLGNVLKFVSDNRSMFTSRVPMDDFPRWKDNKGICSEESVEYEGGMDLYAFKGITNVKNKYGTPFRKAASRVWYKDGAEEPRGFDPVYDCWKFLDTLGAIEGFQPSTITDHRKSFYINLSSISDIKWTWPMFKAYIIGLHEQDRRMLKVANDLGAPMRFNLLRRCRNLLDSGKSEDMIAHVNREKEKQIGKPGGGVDIEAEDEETDD